MAFEFPTFKKSIPALTNVLRFGSEKKATLLRQFKEANENPDYVSKVAFEFPSQKQSDWMNSEPLSFSKDLRGKIVVLDFFTYCCINCMHILPDLAKLVVQHPIQSGLVVIGVHSAKFNNEKDTDHIKDAILRYNISHPVVNDPDIVLWDHLGITCWPTLVIFGPAGQLLYYIIGEGHRDELFFVVEHALKVYGEAGLLDAKPLPVRPLTSTAAPDTLLYPGKVLVDTLGERMFISDTGHHRILEVELRGGLVTKVIGSGRAGLKDGPPMEACFNSPQGLAMYKTCLYVADTENHAIRRVNLDSYSTDTIAGTGVQGKDTEGGREGKLQPISSPWDLAVGQSAESDHSNVLFVAMAGTHQIWAYFLEDTKWLKGVEQLAGSIARFCGSGEELNRNNVYPHKAGFAQPSGLAVADNGCLYVADSESSTIRAVKMNTGAVLACVGGAIDPTDLFAYGDGDGRGRDVRLQHPLGVIWDQMDQVLYVADSYNHKIKSVNVKEKQCVTVAGTGEAGNTTGSLKEAQLSEPNGLAVHPPSNSIYITDTNNHCIKILNLATQSLLLFKLTFAPGRKQKAGIVVDHSLRPTNRLTKQRLAVVERPSLYLGKGRGSIKGTLELCLPPSCSLTEGATSLWQILPESDAVSSSFYSGKINSLDSLVSFEVIVDLSEDIKSASFLFEVRLFYCLNDGTCQIKEQVFRITLQFGNSLPTVQELIIKFQ